MNDNLPEEVVESKPIEQPKKTSKAKKEKPKEPVKKTNIDIILERRGLK